MRGIWSNGPIVDPAAIAITGGSITGTNAPYVLAKSAIPFISASTGSMANNGALSGLTALAFTYANAYIYLPLNAISTGSAAGWYFVQMSSTTAGTVFNNTYTSGMPLIPTSPTAFATTGPGAFTGDITEEAGPTITVPAGAMGPSGLLRITTAWSVPNNANNKTFRVRFSGASGTQYLALTRTAGLSDVAITMIQNRGSESSQWGTVGGSDNPFAFIASGFNTSSVNTSVGTSLVIAPQKATATDNMVLEHFNIEVMYGS